MVKTTLALAVLACLASGAGLEKAPPGSATDDSCCSGMPKTAVVAAETPATQPAVAGHQDAAALFEKLKGMVGTWVGKDSSGEAVKLEYQLTGAGSAVMEIDPGHGGMTTIWTLDGDRVLMTHYCAARNQPRMAAKGMDDGKAHFEFVDASGMKTPNDIHMHEVTYTFTADGKVEQDWTMYKGGKAVGNEKFTMALEK